MSKQSADPTRISEHCEHCGAETWHSVSIEIRQESTREGQAARSREPYRVSVCDQCGTTTQLRMNNQ